MSMPRPSRRAGGLALVLALLLCAPDALAQDTDEFYDQACKGCHTIGGGRLTGPDLKNVEDRKDREWLIRFMLDPQAVIDSGDAYARKIVDEAPGGMIMPKVAGLDRARAVKLMDLIAAESALERSRWAGTSLSERAFTADDRSLGRELFHGHVRFESGAPSCVSCHAVADVGGLGGGQLGPDLSDAYARLEGRKALGAWLLAPATETMAPVYKKHPISEDEILPLLAYLEEQAKSGEVAPEGPGVEFLLIGVLVAAAILFLFDHLWRRRFTSVRGRLVRGQR